MFLFWQITYQLRHILKVPLEPIPQANGAVRFFCDPTFWAKNVVNLGNEASFIFVEMLWNQHEQAVAWGLLVFVSGGETCWPRPWTHSRDGEVTSVPPKMASERMNADS